MLKVALIGAGNLGSHLFNIWCHHSDVQLTQWLNRTSTQSNREGVSIIQSLSQLREADVYHLAIPDREITSVSMKLPADGMAVHSSGTVSMGDLKNKGDKGILYPLQTLTKSEEIDFQSIPFFLETNNEISHLKALADSLSPKQHWMSSEQRLQLHMAAVYVNNFSNHFYQIASEICEKNNVPFEVMLPLIDETARKVHKMSPSLAQTGPARRNDITVIEKHLKHMENPEHREIYQILSHAIQKQFNDKL